MVWIIETTLQRKVGDQTTTFAGTSSILCQLIHVLSTIYVSKNDYDFLWFSIWNTERTRNEYRMNTEWSNRQEGQYRWLNIFGYKNSWFWSNKSREPRSEQISPIIGYPSYGNKTCQSVFGDVCILRMIVMYI